MNLLTNAAEAIAGAGTIRIGTKNQYVDKPVAENQNMETGEYAIISVIDTGKGITKDNIKHIFEPFYTKKILGRSGTGLGLAIVWNTVQDHGGAITVSSSGQGTCFELYFPIIREEISDRKGDVELAQLRGNRELILVVDDEKLQRNIASQMLSILGYQVKTVSSGEKAIDFIRNQSINLVILDMIMDPGINGRQTYEQIIKVRPGQKAIIASGFSETDEVKKAQELGADSFIHKPYTLEQIGIAVKKAIS